MSGTEFCMVITTCANREDAETLASALLREKLAACVQVSEITSYYSWKGEQAKDAECILFIKARDSLYPEIEASLKAHHKYEVPEIIQLPIINGSASYLAWIREVSR